MAEPRRWWPSAHRPRDCNRTVQGGKAGCEESCRCKRRVGYQIAATIINCRDTCIDNGYRGLEVGVPFIITAISYRNSDISYPTVKMHPFINLQQLIRITLIVALVIVFPLACERAKDR
jgi:hypothetical protein